LQYQIERANVTLDSNGIPSASTASDLSFAELAGRVTGDSPQAVHERRLWKLMSILFEPVSVSCARFTEGIPPAEIPTYEARIRRDAVSEFWMDLTKERSSLHARDAASAEEKALAQLSGGNIEGACTALIEGRDFRLATIVSQLPTDQTSKDMMTKQIQSWRSQNVLSEMSQPIRAVYELAAGNPCISEGKGGASEDRAATFGLSETFGLDWKRAFGLRLWYGSDDLAGTIESYSDDVVSTREKVKPLPYFLEDCAASTWDDKEANDREDALFAVLRLYAAKLGSGHVGAIESLLAPAAIAGNPVNSRLTWQLATVLRARGVLSLPDLMNSTLDVISQNLAFQLEAADRLLDTLRVLLHFSGSAAREYYIRNLLYRRAASLDTITATTDPASNELFRSMTQEFHIPASWIWHAKALYAASTHDYDAQTAFLLRADDKEAAHVVLCRHVGPRAVIEMDYDALRELLGSFEKSSSASAAGTSKGKHTPQQAYQKRGGRVDKSTWTTSTSSTYPARAGKKAQREKRRPNCSSGSVPLYQTCFQPGRHRQAQAQPATTIAHTNQHHRLQVEWH